VSGLSDDEALPLPVVRVEEALYRNLEDCGVAATWLTGRNRVVRGVAEPDPTILDVLGPVLIPGGRGVGLVEVAERC